MSMNRVQFLPRMSLSEFQPRFGTDEQCRQALLEARWPYGLVPSAQSGDACQLPLRSWRQLPLSTTITWPVM